MIRFSRPLFRRAYTLVEIMIVVLVIGFLAWLATVVIGFIKNRTAHSLIQNNLRQLYQAKEFYFAETGAGGPVGSSKLIQQGYLSKALQSRLYSPASFETKMGWHYADQFLPGEPTFAYFGPRPSASTPPAAANIEYYPSSPKSEAALFAAIGSTPSGAGGAVTPNPGPARTPSGPLSPPTGLKAGSSPGAPWVASTPAVIPPVREDAPRVFTPDELLKLVGAQNPGGTGQTEVAAVRVDPAIGTVTRQADGSWRFVPASNFHGSNVNLDVTVRNPQGTNTAQAHLDVISVTDPAHVTTTATVRQEVITTGSPAQLGRIQIDRVQAPPLTAMTLEFTVIGQPVAGGGATGPVIVNMGRAGDNNFLSLWNPANMKIGGAGDVATGINLGDGASHRVTLTWDSAGGQLRVYDNGQLKATIPNWKQGQTLPGDLYAVLGGKMNDPAGRGGFNAGEHYDGTIFNTALADRALTPEQVRQGPITTHATGQTGLVFDVRSVAGQLVDTTGRHQLQAQGGLGHSTADVDAALAGVPPGATIRMNLQAQAADPADRVTGTRMVGFLPGTVLSDGTHSHRVASLTESVDVASWNLGSLSAQLPAGPTGQLRATVETTTQGPDGAATTTSSLIAAGAGFQAPAQP